MGSRQEKLKEEVVGLSVLSGCHRYQVIGLSKFPNNENHDNNENMTTKNTGKLDNNSSFLYHPLKYREVNIFGLLNNF